MHQTTKTAQDSSRNVWPNVGPQWIGVVQSRHHGVLSYLDLGNLEARSTSWPLCHFLGLILSSFCSAAGDCCSQELVYLVCNGVLQNHWCYSFHLAVFVMLWLINKEMTWQWLNRSPWWRICSLTNISELVSLLVVLIYDLILGVLHLIFQIRKQAK